MAWLDRLKEAAYTSPGGTRTVFAYGDVGRSVEKLTNAYEFPGSDQTYVQDLGHSGRRFPIRAVFHGADCDTQASAFEGALLERGQGVLEHPLYGTFPVVPFGVIERRDALVTAANQATVEVTFWQTTGAAFVADQVTPAAVAVESIEQFNESMASEFEQTVDVVDSAARASLREQIRAGVNAVKSALRAVADKTEQVQRQFDAVFTSIESGIDILIGTPLTVAFQVLTLIETPARASALIADKLDAYGNLADTILARALPVASYDNQPANEFHASDLLAQGSVGGVASSVVASTFASQPEAISAADALADLFDAVTAWRDAGFVSVGVTDTGEAYQALQGMVATVLGYLIATALSLPRERVITLDRPRCIIDLVAELYGVVDDQLDQFIALNSLTGDEIIELPVGRRVVYYV